MRENIIQRKWFTLKTKPHETDDITFVCLNFFGLFPFDYYSCTAVPL